MTVFLGVLCPKDSSSVKITAENEGKQRFRRERFNREGAMARGDAKRDFFTAENERKQRFRRVRLNREDAMARGYAKRDFFTAENGRTQRLPRVFYYFERSPQGPMDRYLLIEVDFLFSIIFRILLRFDRII